MCTSDTVEDIERKLKHASHSIEVYNAKLDRAMKELTVKQGKDNLLTLSPARDHHHAQSTTCRDSET